jgi:hypothetical protein
VGEVTASPSLQRPRRKSEFVQTWPIQRAVPPERWESSPLAFQGWRYVTAQPREQCRCPAMAQRDGKGAEL